MSAGPTVGVDLGELALLRVDAVAQVAQREQVAAQHDAADGVVPPRTALRPASGTFLALHSATRSASIMAASTCLPAFTHSKSINTLAAEALALRVAN